MAEQVAEARDPDLGRGLRQLRAGAPAAWSAARRGSRAAASGPARRAASRDRAAPRSRSPAGTKARAAALGRRLECGLHRHKARPAGRCIGFPRLYRVPAEPPEGIRLGLPASAAGRAASRRRVRIELGGETVADSTRALRVLETASPPTIYVPREDVREELLSDADGRPHRLRVEGPRPLPARRGRRRPRRARRLALPRAQERLRAAQRATSPSTPAASTPATSTTSRSPRRAAASTAAGSPPRSRAPTRASRAPRAGEAVFLPSSRVRW